MPSLPIPCAPPAEGLAGASSISGPGFGISISPSIGRPRPAGADHEEEREVLQPRCTVKGWFLPPEGTGLRGLRVQIDGQVVVARRKQLRPDILKAFPSRPEALLSGFTASLLVAAGHHEARFQYKDDHGRWHTFATCRLRLSRWWWLRRNRARLPANAYEDWRLRHAAMDAGALRHMSEHIARFPRHPLISVLMPVYNTPEKWLTQALDSVRAQVYPHWELCVADDCSTAPHVRAVLQRYASRDSRIKLVFRPENGHICHASNSALETCAGEFTALLDHDDELSPDALYHVAWQILRHPEASLFFSDEDKIDEDGVRSDPYFKPGWNYDLLLSQNAVSHLGVFRTSLLRELGGFRPGFEGSQDWDLTLRAVAALPRHAVRHIPRVLYHWRTLPGSTATAITAKPYAEEAGRRAVEQHVRRVHADATLQDLPGAGWRVCWPIPEPAPRVSIIIPTHNRADLLRTLLDSLFQLTDYPQREVIVVDHASDDPATQTYLSNLVAQQADIRVVRAEGPFNWSRLNNLAVAQAQGSLLVFLNNDMEILEAGWLTELVRHASRPDVGAVGAALVYPTGQLQHAGVVLRMTGVAGHVYRRWQPQVETFGGGRPFLVREVTAVTGACLAVRAELFHQVGGFDEEYLPTNYNDIDFCLKLRSKGYRNIFTPFAKLVHQESVSRRAMESLSTRKAEATAEARVVLERWPQEFEGDAFYNPHFALDAEVPALGEHGLPHPWEIG